MTIMYYEESISIESFIFYGLKDFEILLIFKM